MATSFQPRFPEIRYALGRLVVDRANSLGLSRRQLVDQLGYQRRKAKGHQVLAEFLAGENLSPPFVSHLPTVLRVEPSTLAAALVATVRELDAEAAVRALDVEQEYQSSFRPHIQVQCERRIPSPIFAVALIGVRKLRTIEMPTEVIAMDEAERDEIARDAILRHHHTSRGVVPCFGMIVGYLLVLVAGFSNQDFGIPFDCRGRRIGSMTTVPRLLNGRLGKRHADGRLNGLLKATLVQVDR